MKLFLIRHGNTDWADTGRHTGRTDVPLNPAGEVRARQLAARLARETFSRVFTSPLARARRTCELAGLGDRTEIAADLAEWNYGDYEGLRSAEIRGKNPGWNLFRDGAPGGESPAHVAERADRFVAMVRSLKTDVAAFSHGHMIRVIAARWLGLPISAAALFATATASVNILGYEHETDPVILLWNQT